MTIKQFQELHYIVSGKDTDIDKSVKMVGAVTGITPDKVEAMPMGKFNRICAKINKQFEVLGKKLNEGNPRKLILVKGQVFQINYDVANAGKYVEAMEFNKDIITNLHKIMATLCTRVKFRWGRFVPVDSEHSDRATVLENMNFEAAYHAAVFFYLQYITSMRVIHPYLVKEGMKKGLTKETMEAALMNLQTVLAGYSMPKWCQNLNQYLLQRFGN
jgi:hypothetical protein